jgi:hypothetical protein
MIVRGPAVAYRSIGIFALAWLVACGGASASTPGSLSSRSEEARSICGRVCARCHAPPEVGQHARAELEDILSHHRTRARLTEEQWAMLVDLLAKPDETGAPR